MQEMTPVQRRNSLARGEEADRVPCQPFIDNHAAVLCGRSLEDYALDPEVMVECQIAAYRRYGHDMLSVFTDGYLIAEAMGARLTYSDDSPPYLAEPARLSDPDGLPELTTESGRLPGVLAAIGTLLREVGHEVPVGCAVHGPVTTAAGLVGVERLLVAMVRDPAYVEALVDAVVEGLLTAVGAYLDLGAAVGITDPVCSGNLISPAAYRRFGLPVQRRIVEFARQRGFGCGLHICGRTEGITGAMADTGASTLSVDDVDLEAASSIVGTRAALQTGPRSASTLLLGSPEDVRAEATGVLERLPGHSGGFILGTTCEVPPATPPENVAAIRDAAAAAGPYRCPDSAGPGAT